MSESPPSGARRGAGKSQAREAQGREKVRRGRRREGRSRGDGLRICAGCGEACDPQGLLRLVAGPDGRAHVDVRGKAPGRGCYLHARLRCFQEAVKRRKVGRTLKTDGLIVDLEALLAEARAGVVGRIGHLLSLSQKAGRIVSGAETVHRTLDRGGIAVLLVAPDASPQTAERVIGWGRASGVAVFETSQTVEDLGRLLGKAPRAVVGLRPGELARTLQRELTNAEAIGAGPRCLGF